MPKAPDPDPICRGEPIVRRVLGATLAVLGRGGYAALSVERVAARARVNKTTVYRRWPTKLDLIRAAFVAVGRESWQDPDTGTLRGDLLAIARSNLRFARSARGKAIVRTLLGGDLDADLKDVILAIRASFDARSRDVVRRAVARGEVRSQLDHELLIELIVGAVHHGSLLGLQTGRADHLEKLIDLILLGILSPGARQLAPSVGLKRRVKRPAARRPQAGRALFRLPRAARQRSP